MEITPDVTTTTVTVLGAEYPARTYIGDAGQVSDIETDGAVQAAIEARVAELITRHHAERTKRRLPVERGPIQTAMAVQREITAMYRYDRICDYGGAYHATGYPAEIADYLNHLHRRLESIVIRWMCEP